MAHSISARKRARQNTKRNLANASQRSRFRTTIKRVLAAVEADDKQAAQDAYAKAVPAIDKAAGKGLIHANKAARQKSRLVKRIKAMA